MASLFTEVLGVEVASADDDFFALGGDEASTARLLDAVAEDAGVRLPVDALSGSSTVRALAAQIAASRPTRNARVVGYGTDLPGRPFFCLMMAFQARAVARAFNESTGRPFYVVQPAGLEGRARVDRSVAKRARRALADIRSIQPEGPYSLAGYSSDSFITFEVARLLLEAGEEVELLAAIDHWAPVYSWWDVANLHRQRHWKEVCAWSPRRGRCFDARRRVLFLRANFLEIAERVKWRLAGRTAGLVPRRATRQGKLFHELTLTTISGFRADPLDIDVRVIRADDFGGWDWLVRRAPTDMLWHRVATRGVEVVEIPGDHISILEPGYANDLARALADGVRTAAGEPVVQRGEPARIS